METKFKVGEKVRIRSWEDMKNEYGERCGTIPCRCTFTSRMKGLCGRTATIEKICPDGEIYLKDWSDSSNVGWQYSTDMIEKLKPIKLEDLQFADVLTLRKGERYVYASGYMYGEDSDYYNDCDKLKWYYNKDLTFEGKAEKEKDIIKVERNGLVIFERTEEEEEVKEMTLKEVCDALGYEVKIKKEN